MTRKVDPVHFFDHKGNSILAVEHVMQKNRELEAEVAKLKRLLAAQVKKNAALLEDHVVPTQH